MIYEGALIQRLVAPGWPGDPDLAAGGAPEFRTEWVLSDQPGKPVKWTLQREEGQHYPTHLAASRRAKELGAHCHASVVGGGTGDDQYRIPNGDFQTQDGEAVSRLAHNQKIVGSTPTPATNLPAVGSSTAGAVKQLPRLGVKKRRGASGGNQSTSTRKARPAGISFSARADALRAAADRTAPTDQERFWWRQGQFA